MFYDIRLKALSQGVIMSLIRNMYSEIMLLKLLTRLLRTIAWCRHQMETFSALLAICAGNSPVTSEFPAQRPVTQSFDVFIAPE